MPYCSKCGVEVDNDVRKCPLCQFKIPEIDGLIIEPGKFPIAINQYPEQIKELKMKIFKITSVFFCSTIIILLLLNRKISGKITWSKYTTLVFFAIVMYSFFSLRFSKNFKKAFTCMTLVTVVLLFAIDNVNNGLSWFVPIGLPITLSLFFIVITIVMISRQLLTKGLNIIALSLLGVSILCLVIEFCITNYLYGYIDLTWSAIVLVQLTAISIILFYIHYKFPEKYKNKIKRFFHI